MNRSGDETLAKLEPTELQRRGSTAGEGVKAERGPSQASSLIGGGEERCTKRSLRHRGKEGGGAARTRAGRSAEEECRSPGGETGQRVDSLRWGFGVREVVIIFEWLKFRAEARKNPDGWGEREARGFEMRKWRRMKSAEVKMWRGLREDK